MKKGTHFIIPIVVYPFDVMVSVAETDLSLVTSLLRRGIDKEDVTAICYKNPQSTGRTVMFSGGQTVLRLRKYPKCPVTKGVLAHEVFHAVHFILDRIGTPLEIEKSDESYAYLIQYLTKEIYNKLK